MLQLGLNSRCRWEPFFVVIIFVACPMQLPSTIYLYRTKRKQAPTDAVGRIEVDGADFADKRRAPTMVDCAEDGI
jgi:hypothetical protein